MPQIILIEDDVFLAEIYQTRLELAGLACLVANDGKSGLELVRKTIPDLVLLDLMLPEMSGDEVLRAMRESDWGKDIKVIILTNISEAEAPETLKNYHFERYIVKASLTKNELPAIIGKTLGLPASPELDQDGF